MRIGFVIGGIKGGGAERVVCNLANYFVMNNDSVEIVSFTSGENYGLDKRVAVYYLDRDCTSGSRFANKIKKYNNLKRYMRQSTCNVIVAFLPVEICLCAHLRKKNNAKVIASERNDPSTYPYLIQVLLKYYVRKVDGMVFQTEDVKSWYKSIRIEEDEVIPNPISESFVNRSIQSRNRNGDIVGIGRLSEQKNWDMLLHAYSRIPVGLRKNRLVIYGKGDKKNELENLANKLGIANDVLFPGFIDDIPKVLEDASMFVLSSKYEGMPNSLMEAMAIGLPCVATDCPVGGPRALIRTGDNGVLVKNNSVDEMVKGIMCFLENPDFADSCGIKARSVSDSMNISVIGEKWKHFFEKVVKERNS